MWPMLIKQIAMITVAAALDCIMDDDRKRRRPRQKWRGICVRGTTFTSSCMIV
jgi:hypothetical protein